MYLIYRIYFLYRDVYESLCDVGPFSGRLSWRILNYNGLLEYYIYIFCQITIRLFQHNQNAMEFLANQSKRPSCVYEIWTASLVITIFLAIIQVKI